MPALEYATLFSNVLRELYGQELTCNDLYNSNSDIQIVNGKDIKIPKLSVSGYKDHTRGAGGFNKLVLMHQKQNKKWNVLTPLLIVLGILFVIVPAMIVGDNNGQAKPIYFYILVIFGMTVIASGLISLLFKIFHLMIISKNKKYRDIISHELTDIVSKKEQVSNKEFDFIKNLIK